MPAISNMTRPGLTTATHPSGAPLPEPTYGRLGVKVWIYKGEVLTQTLRTTPRTIDTKNYKEREQRPRNPYGCPGPSW